MNDINKGLIYGIAQVQMLEKPKQEYANMMSWCEKVRELDDERLALLLRSVEHHLGREINLWPDDPSNERALAIRLKINAENAQFAKMGSAINAPQTSVVKFL